MRRCTVWLLLGRWAPAWRGEDFTLWTQDRKVAGGPEVRQQEAPGGLGALGLSLSFSTHFSLSCGVPGVHVVINFTDGKLMHFLITASEPSAFSCW